MNKNLRTFYVLMITQTISLVGSQMSGFAVGIWIFQETGSATPLAIVSTFAVLPAIFLAGFGGVYADRFDRRYMMMVGDAGQAFATLLLLISIGSDSFELWHLYATAGLSAIFGGFQFPAFMASVTMLVPDEQRDRANAIQQMTGPVSGIVAPILASLTLVAIGITGVILVDLVTFLIAVGIVFMVDIPIPAETAEGQAQKGSVWKEMQVGFKYLWGHKRLLFWFALYGMAINFPIRVMGVLSTPYILLRTESEVWLGIMSGAASMAILAGGILFSIRGGLKTRVQTITFTMTWCGIFIVFYGMSRDPILLLVILVLGYFPVAAVDASLMSLIQLKIPADLQGRVFAAIGQLVMVLRPLAFITAGVLADEVFEPAVGSSAWEVFAPFVGNGAGAGMGLLILLSGISIVVLSLGTYARRDIRGLETTLPDYEAKSKESVGVADAALAPA